MWKKRLELLRRSYLLIRLAYDFQDVFPSDTAANATTSYIGKILPLPEQIVVSRALQQCLHCLQKLVERRGQELELLLLVLVFRQQVQVQVQVQVLVLGAGCRCWCFNNRGWLRLGSCSNRFRLYFRFWWSWSGFGFHRWGCRSFGGRRTTSTVIKTSPIAMVCPDSTLILATVPVTVEGTGTDALSVSTSTISSPSETVSPTLTKISRMSPDSIPSPSSGSLISVAMFCCKLLRKRRVLLVTRKGD